MYPDLTGRDVAGPIVQQILVIHNAAVRGANAARTVVCDSTRSTQRVHAILRVVKIADGPGSYSFGIYSHDAHEKRRLDCRNEHLYIAGKSRVWPVVGWTVNSYGHIVAAIRETVRSRIGICGWAASRGAAAIRNLGGSSDRGAIGGGRLQAFLEAQIAKINRKPRRQDKDGKPCRRQQNCLSRLVASPLHCCLPLPNSVACTQTRISGQHLPAPFHATGLPNDMNVRTNCENSFRFIACFFTYSIGVIPSRLPKAAEVPRDFVGSLECTTSSRVHGYTPPSTALIIQPRVTCERSEPP